MKFETKLIVGFAAAGLLAGIGAGIAGSIVGALVMGSVAGICVWIDDCL
jgi:hypothetical protein